MVTYIWVVIGSGIGLPPDDTKPLPNADFSLMSFFGIRMRTISQQVFNLIFFIISLKTILLKLLAHELKVIAGGDNVHY